MAHPRNRYKTKVLRLCLKWDSERIRWTNVLVCTIWISRFKYPKVATQRIDEFLPSCLSADNTVVNTRHSWQYQSILLNVLHNARRPVVDRRGWIYQRSKKKARCEMKETRTNIIRRKILQRDVTPKGITPLNMIGVPFSFLWRFRYVCKTGCCMRGTPNNFKRVFFSFYEVSFVILTFFHSLLCLSKAT